MRLLIDTHLLLWCAAWSSKLPEEARTLLEDPGNDLHHSAASLWELAIKTGLRRNDFSVDLGMLRRALSRMGFIELPITGAHTEELLRLPDLHKDPFDRMLVAQSLSEPLVLLTNDVLLAGYGSTVRLVT